MSAADELRRVELELARVRVSPDAALGRMIRRADELEVERERLRRLVRWQRIEGRR